MSATKVVIGLVLLAEVLAMLFAARWAEAVWAPSREGVGSLALPEGVKYRDAVAKITQRDPRSQSPLAWYGRLAGLDRRIRPGKHSLDPKWAPAQALESLAMGAKGPRRVTLFPGYGLRDCARSLEMAGWIEAATPFLRAASRETVVNGVGIPNLEGLIAADTFLFDETEPHQKVLQALHEGWRRLVLTVAGTEDLRARLRNGLTLYDTIILASILQKEAGSVIELGTASSVFHNRLRKNWPLGSAATLRYALPGFVGEDSELPIGLKSPFNTSRKPGLPPHPICIPSAQALAAAISPPKTDYLFFVSDGEGGLSFSKSLKEHHDLVKVYRQKIKSRGSPPSPLSAGTIPDATGSDGQVSSSR